MKINERMELSIDDIQEAFNNLAASSSRGREAFKALKEISIEAWRIAERRLSKPELIALVNDFKLYCAGHITIGEVEQALILNNPEPA